MSSASRLIALINLGHQSLLHGLARSSLRPSRAGPELAVNGGGDGSRRLAFNEVSLNFMCSMISMLLRLSSAAARGQVGTMREAKEIYHRPHLDFMNPTSPRLWGFGFSEEIIKRH
jgi:hypothetical protein